MGHFSLFCCKDKKIKYYDDYIITRCRCCEMIFYLCLECSHELTDDHGYSICRCCLTDTIRLKRLMYLPSQK